MKLLIFFLLLSFTCRAQVKPNYKDSAYKYWKLFTAYQDSAIDAHAKHNMLHFNYWVRKEMEARRISYKYAEKQ